MSKNLIERLPTYIGRMQDLKILKIDHNPISFPPTDVLKLAGEGEDFRDTRLDLIKRYLRNAENKETVDTESVSRYEGVFSKLCCVIPSIMLTCDIAMKVIQTTHI